MTRSSALRVVPSDGGQPTCGGETKSGRPCRRQVSSQDEHCAQHTPDLSTVRAAADAGRRELLAALRNKIAADIDEGVPARDLASLSKRLLDISKELDDVTAAEDGDDISEAAATPDEPWDGG